MTTVLSAQGVSVSFGAVRALDGVDLEVQSDQLVGLIGPNGAGKTTFIDAVTGFVPSRGEITLGGRRISGMAPHDRARLRLARTWQTIELFDDLSVRENLSVSSRRSTMVSTVSEVLFGRPPRAEALAEEAMHLLELDEDAERMPNELPQGRRKLVGIARALASKPQLLLMDEPAAGLATNESLELGRILRNVVDSGLPILLVDHDMGLVLGICDYIYVLDFGKIIAQGTAEEIRHNPQVLAAYLGGSTSEAVATAEAAEEAAESEHAAK
ncbi:MAG: ABC transporter ATP-binding protein [Acidimicrobiaceae bacterium]|nr:ABC transporter ATP-binding protein [Acidimicrobiaceae bacterium]